MKTYRFLLIAVISFCVTVGLRAQGTMTFQAYPDNAFVEPGYAFFKVIDVLANDHYYFEGPNECQREDLEFEIIVKPKLGLARETDDNKIEYRPAKTSFGPDSLVYRITCYGDGSGPPEVSEATLYINVNDQPSVISDKDCYVDPIAAPWGINEIAKSPTSEKVSMVSSILTGDIDGDGKVEIFAYSANDNRILYQPTSFGACDAINVFGYDSENPSELKLKYKINLPGDQIVYPYGNFAIANVDEDGYGAVFVYYLGHNIGDPITPIMPYTAARDFSEPLLIKYKFDPSLNGGNGDFREDWRVTPYNNVLYRNASPVVTDIMGNGRKQVCIYDKIYDASTGELLIDAGLIPESKTFDIPRNAETSFGLFGHSGVAATADGFYPTATVARYILMSYQSLIVAQDIDGDGIKELIAGDCVYKVNLDFDDPTNNSFYLYKRANKAADNVTNLTPRLDIVDGSAVLADLDNDGQLEVIVTAKRLDFVEPGTLPLNANRGVLYIYNPRTGEVLNNNVIDLIPTSGPSPGLGRPNIAGGPSIPFVGDIDGDGYPEIAFTSWCTLQAYKFNPSTKALSMMWNLPTTDTSASTTLSLFDFTQSGKSQLVYRDETELRIIDGRINDDDGNPIITEEQRTLARFQNVCSATINEYPVVADIDGDGHAEIIVTARDSTNIRPQGVTWDFRGEIRVYSSLTAPWAPARPVWNQMAYNPLYVNDDLTIPAYPISPATAFVSPDGKLDRPFNNFLQQATNLNKEGLMIMLGPDLLFDARVPKRITIDDDANTLEVEVGIMNQGDAIFNGPIKLQMYAYTEIGKVFRKIGAPYIYANPSGLDFVSTDNTKKLSYIIPDKDNELNQGYDNLFMTINLDTKPGEFPAVFSGSAECHDGINNFTSGFSIVNGNRVICEGDTETITVTPNGTYHVKWFANAKGGSHIGEGDSYAVTKNADIIQYLFVETYKTAASSSPISTIRDTVFIYKTPDSLIWTGNAGNSDWHDIKNWKNPIVDYPEAANIPRKCTNVFIPRGISNYPNLAPKSTLPSTQYENYNQSECNNIHFAFGSEVVRPDKLVYAKAYVDLTFNSHRWHMFAPPLKGFYTGDIYRNNIIPFYDDVKAYTKFWSRRNPSNNYYTSGWTQLFHKPDLSFEAGQGLGVWISDKAIDGQTNPPRDPFEFAFPKLDAQYSVYIVDTDIPDPALSPYTTDRTNSHRFIFDGATEGSDFNLKIDGETKTVGQMVLVGNPFMAHLDFDEFYSKNSAYIQNYYSILDENTTMLYYNKGVTSTLTKNIAPMQAFLVEIKAPFSNLRANGLMTRSVPGDKLKNSLEVEGFQLRITATQAEHSSQAVIDFNKKSDNKYKPGEDIAGLFPSKKSSDSRALTMYSLTEDGTKVAINRLNSAGIKDKVIPLGIWSAKNSPISINVSNINQVPTEYSLFLHDARTNESYNLSQNSMKAFESIKADANSFIDERFSLRFKVDTGSSIDENPTDEDFSAYVKNSTLHLIGNENFEAVQVYNLQGQLLYSVKLDTNSAECKLPYANLYIVKIKNSRQVVLKKLLNL